MSTLNTPYARQFRNKIRHYNCALAFTSINYTKDERLRRGFRPFQIQGELYHLLGPIENEPGVAPAFSQIWIHDP
jgi:hypothetical protein